MMFRTVSRMTEVCMPSIPYWEMATPSGSIIGTKCTHTLSREVSPAFFSSRSFFICRITTLEVMYSRACMEAVTRSFFPAFWLPMITW